jgi:transcriptional regulator with XRE-family HTH domain
MQFGEYLREKRERLRREDRHFSLRKVAGRIGVEPAYLSKIERDVIAPPSEATTVKLAKELGEDGDW